MSPSSVKKSDAPNAEPVARFESAMKELEALVQAMERGELSLEDSLQAYERGMILSEECRVALESAELKIKTLSSKASPAA